jgi:hypothetical protein
MAVKHFPMVHARAAVALDPRLFGRAHPRFVERSRERRWTVRDDIWLFGSTFAAGFLFVSILLA